MKYSKSEVHKTIMESLNPHKAPGYDLITGKILRELPKEGFIYLTKLYNSIQRCGFYPPQWKVAEVIMIPKPGKPPEDTKSYRPINLLPITSKVFEKLLLSRLLLVITEKNLIPNYQFGFRQKHSTIEQIHRIVVEINKAFETRKYIAPRYSWMLHRLLIKYGMQACCIN